VDSRGWCGGAVVLDGFFVVLLLGNCCWHILQLLWNVDAVVFAVAASNNGRKQRRIGA